MHLANEKVHTRQPETFHEQPYIERDYKEIQIKFLKTKNNTDTFNHNKQRNFWVFLIQKEKSKYFSNLNIKNVTENKKILENY